MTEATRDELIDRLGRLMSDISEDCYYAAWLGGTEYFVPELCRRAVSSQKAQHWGHGVVTPARGHELLDLAGQLGHWVELDEQGIGYQPFEPFPIPPEYLNALDREEEYGRRNRERPKGTRPE